MRGLRGLIGLWVALAAVGCEDERPAGTHPSRLDAAVQDAAGEDAAVPDAGGPLDAGEVPDAGAVDTGFPHDSGGPDAAPVDAGAPDGAPLDGGAPDTGVGLDAAAPDSGTWCGDGVRGPGETCDDGVITSGCDTYHDGGDGACWPPGQCAQGYLLDTIGTCVPARLDTRVIIDVDNFCNMAVTPVELVVPRGQTVYVDWYNRSRDYPVDVWLSYGGGYLDLLPGTTWDEPIRHCGTPNPHDEYADISTACSMFRFYFRCQ